MRYRLPLELELTILEFAAPPLAIDSLHDRVHFFIKISLVHRSLTAWAKDRLRDQFLYTYRARSDEHERLKTRLEAGFGSDGQLRRLYLDLTRLPSDIDGRTEPGTDSVSATINGRVYEPVSFISGSGYLEQVGTTAQGQAREAVAHYVQNGTARLGTWGVCAMITAFSEALDALWLKLPIIKLNVANLPPPRLLYIDDGAVNDPWGWFGLLPISGESVLFLRNIGFDLEDDPGNLHTRHLILDQCWAVEMSMSDLLHRFHQLDTVVLYVFGMFFDESVRVLASLPTTIRRVHVLENNFRNEPDPPDARHVLPLLESFTFTLLSSRDAPADDGADQDALAEVEQAVKSIIDAPQCTFKYVRWTEPPEEALADALATFDL